MGSGSHRILIHLADGLRRVVDPAEAFHLEAVEGATRVRLRGARPLVDVRRLGEVLPLFAPHRFLRIHREHAVNLDRVHEIRRRSEGRDWEVKLAPPVNRVLPVSRDLLRELWQAFER